MKRILPSGPLALAALAVSLFSSACTNHHYRQSADRAAYGAIREKTPLVTNMDEHFSVEWTNQIDRALIADLPVANRVEEFLGPYGPAEQGARILSLERAL